FCVQTILVCNASNPPERVKVLISCGEFREEHDLPPEHLQRHKDRAAKVLADESKEFEGDEPPKFRIVMGFEISPMVFEQQGRLLVHVETETERMRAGSLNIMKKLAKVAESK